MFGEPQFLKTYFLLGPLLKYAGLKKTISWTSVWDSGFQRTHIQIFGESQFQNAIFYYDDWIKDIKIAQLSSGGYEKVFTKFTNQRKTVSAYIALCERFGKSEECATFLELLNEELEDDDEDADTFC